MLAVNHRLPSGPAVIATGWENWSGRANSVTWPAGVIRPTTPPRKLPTNQRLPSGPAVIAPAGFPVVGNSVTWPEGEMRPTSDWAGSVNQTLPSGPRVMAVAPKPPPELSGGRVNSVMALGTQRSSRAMTRGRKWDVFVGRTVVLRNGQNIAISSGMKEKRIMA